MYGGMMKPDSQSGKSAEVVKLSFCNHNGRNWFQQKFSMNAQLRGKFWWVTRYVHCLKRVCPQTSNKLQGRKKAVFIQGINLPKPWPDNQNKHPQ